MIVCCGEALIDMIPATLDGEAALLPKAGGGIFNTAIACARLGVKTGLISGISEDLFGQQLVAHLEQSGVSTQLLIKSKRPTTLAFVSLSNGQASYTFYDENSAGNQIAPDTELVVPDEVSAMVFGGISLITPPAADFYLSLAERERDKRVVMLDPNIRPAFITEQSAYRARLDQLFAACDVVKLSDEDLDWLLEGDEASTKKASQFSHQGDYLLVLTRGELGSAVYRAGELLAEAKAVPTKIVDTVGAGDTFNAGFLAALSQKEVLEKSALVAADKQTLSDALEYAAKAASITASRAGANPPWVDELA